jgi:two-component system sensor histidine kinase/response regulator
MHPADDTGYGPTPHAAWPPRALLRAVLPTLLAVSAALLGACVLAVGSADGQCAPSQPVALAAGGLGLAGGLALVWLQRRLAAATRAVAEPLAALQALAERLARNEPLPGAAAATDLGDGAGGPVTVTAAHLVSLAEHLARARARVEALDAAWSSLPLPAFREDTEGYLADANPALLALLGLPRQEVLGRHARNLLPPAHRNGDPGAEDCPAGERPEETEIGDAGGRRRELLIRRVPLEDGGTLAVLTDVSEQRRTERELAFLRDRALEAARLKSEFMAAVSHELRTPLNGVIGMTDLLLDGPLGATQRHRAQVIASSADKLQGLIDRLLDFSALESGHLALAERPFSPRELLADLSATFTPRAAHKGLTLAGQAAEDLPERLYGDAGRLRQVLVNLLDNAIKFTPSGQVGLRARPERIAGEWVLLRWEVSDTGIGIPPTAYGRLFQPFTQVDGSTTRPFGGTGLGLAICKRLVESMGGEIGFTSTPGQGSTFHLVIPLRTAEPVTAASAAAL